MKLPDGIRSGLIKLAMRLLGCLPLGFNQWLGRLAGGWAFRLKTRAAGITATNISLCFPELSPEARADLAKASLKHTGMTLCETASIWCQPAHKMSGRIRRVEGEHLLNQMMAKGQGLLLLLPHHGNWEAFCYWFGVARGGLTVLYRPPRIAGLEPFMKAARTRAGNQLVPTSKSGLRQLFKALERGEVAAILPDQVPSSGHYAPFFGTPALSDILASRLVRYARPGVLCGLARRNAEGTFDIVIKPAEASLDSDHLDTSTKALNRSIEACILECPEQYQWEYKRFRFRPDGSRRPYPGRRRRRRRG